VAVPVSVSDVVVASERRFAAAVSLVADAGENRLGGRRERMRQLARLVAHISTWAEKTRRDAKALEALGEVDVEPMIARTIDDRASRKATLIAGRAAIEEARRGIALLGLHVRYLESAIGPANVVGIRTDAEERRRMKQLERASLGLRSNLARLIEAINDNLDIMCVIVARLDPENEAPPRSLADVEAAGVGAAK
jgi:hypothetical protein